jgi:hypothetical protein
MSGWINMKKSTFCKNNKEALRWCSSRKAIIQFANWQNIKKKKNIPAGVTCCVALGRLIKIDKTLIKTVNVWIKQFNKEKKEDEKRNKKIANFVVI